MKLILNMFFNLISLFIGYFQRCQFDLSLKEDVNFYVKRVAEFLDCAFT